RTGVNENIATIRGGAGTFNSNASVSEVRLKAHSGTNNQYSENYRFLMGFDTSSIGATSTITSATLSFRAFDKTNALGEPTTYVVSATPASNTALANSDYSQVGSTSFGTLTYASASTAGYNDITLDSNGIANISKTGVSKFALRNQYDFLNSTAPSWFANLYAGLRVYTDDQFDTANDPKLTVIYSEPFIPKTIIIQ